jgi:hypothetical protein
MRGELSDDGAGAGDMANVVSEAIIMKERTQKNYEGE